ncbi:MAG: hypothetical protein ACLFP9_00285 [Desulfonatronovibrio sp.]
MKLTDDKYMGLAEMYFWAGMGQRIHGLIHNLNNHIHVVDMQLSMLVARSDSSGKDPLGCYKEKISRLASGTSKMVDSLQRNGQCSFFAQKSQTQINVKDYLGWILAFWNNDLFFKHKVSCELVFANKDINLQVPPFYLTFCIDQGIRNALEACQEMNPDGEHRMILEADSKDRGVSLAIISFTEMAEIDPWGEGTSSKSGHLGMGLPVCAFLARRMGWDIDLQNSGDETRFLISIPELKSEDSG